MKTKLLLYCTKGKPYLFNRIIKGKSVGYYTDIVPYDIEDEYLCGKIVAECECEVEKITPKVWSPVKERELLELKEVDKLDKGKCESAYIPLTKAPQNMCLVWYKGQKYVLVSIRPEWLCKILNGEITHK